jgi:aminoglycoside phosphotransferase (APT) family kinase protein
MTRNAERDDGEIVAGLSRWLTRDHDLADLSLTGLQRPSAGYSSDTMLIDATWTEGGSRCARPLVIRMAPAGDGTFPDYDLVAQGQAQAAAADAGTPVADPVVETDPGWLGAPFMVMRRVDGHIVGALTHRDRWLSGLDPSEQRQVYENFVSMLATIHRADVHAAPAVPHRDNTAELDFWERYLRWSSADDPVPALVEALAWCRAHQPSTEPPPALLWGDVRFENQVIGDDLLARAVLDWDMATVGAPEHDLAWFTSLDLTMHQLFGERRAAFPDRADTVALFEEYSGRPVRDLEWYETLAMVRSSAIMTRLGYLRRAAGEPLLVPIEDNPILDLVKSRLG